MTLVGVGVYRGITWEIYRYVNNNNKCHISISSIFLLDDKHSSEFMTENNVYLIDGKYQTDNIYKRKECREIARILCLNLWRLYDRYRYKNSRDDWNFKNALKMKIKWFKENYKIKIYE